MLFRLFESKKKKFFREALQLFFYFGDKAGLNEKEIINLLPKDIDSKLAINEIFSKHMKPIDAAMVISDLSVRNASSEKDDKKFEKASKLQTQAFLLGPELGSLIALQEGQFKNLFDKFTKEL